ncbi:RNA polymerase sigma factor [Falsibacillus pallidus]|uniref:RNA polymerase sigma factor n=1 Tax=Falsibacillus pallidus TaxID=493781 RepID=UPI003D979140
MIELVAAAQNGDEKAFLKLFQEYEVDIYRVAYVYVKNQEDALDVVQETAYKSFKKIKSLKNPAFFKTWLIKITMSCATDMVRKKKKVVYFNSEYTESLPQDEEDIPLSLSLKELIETLQENEKNIVLLKFYHEYTFQEISEILKVPLGTVKSILYRSLHKLRAQIKEGEG